MFTLTWTTGPQVSHMEYKHPDCIFPLSSEGFFSKPHMPSKAHLSTADGGCVFPAYGSGHLPFIPMTQNMFAYQTVKGQPAVPCPNSTTAFSPGHYSPE